MLDNFANDCNREGSPAHWRNREPLKMIRSMGGMIILSSVKQHKTLNDAAPDTGPQFWVFGRFDIVTTKNLPFVFSISELINLRMTSAIIGETFSEPRVTYQTGLRVYSFLLRLPNL